MSLLKKRFQIFKRFEMNTAIKFKNDFIDLHVQHHVVCVYSKFIQNQKMNVYFRNEHENR